MQALLFDIDGVLFQQGQAIAGAADTLRWARQQQIPFRLLTNTTSKSRARICSDLNDGGIAVTEELIITPPVAARQWLQQAQIECVELLVPDGIRREFAGLENGAAEAVIVGDMGAGFTFAALNHAFCTLMAGGNIRLVALGMTRYFQAKDGLQLDVGPFVKALEYASGRTALVMGKPAVDFFQLALDGLQTAAEHTLMLGDDRMGDVLGAQSCGIHGCLVRTGKYRAGDEAADEQGRQAEYLLDSVADLPALWARLNSS